MLRRLRGKGLNIFFNQSFLNGFLHFQKCLQRKIILAGKQVDYMLSEEETKSESQYVMT